MENIYTASKPFYLFAKFLGLFPFSYDGPAAKGLLTIKWYGCASSTFSLMFCLALIAWSFYGKDYSASVSPMMSKVWMIWTNFGMFLVLIQLFIQIGKRESFGNFLRTIDHFDRKAQTLNLSVDFKLHHKLVKQLIFWIFGICLFLSIATPLFAYQQNISTGFVLLPLCVYQLVHNCFYTSQFALASLAVRERFMLINRHFSEVERISQFINVGKFQTTTVKSETPQHKIVHAHHQLRPKIYSELYNDLCDIIEIINSSFTIHIIFVLTLLLVTNIFAAYSALRELRQASYMFYFSIGANLVWTVAMVLLKTLIAYSGDSTTSEAERSLVIVTKAIANVSSNIELKNELNFLLIQMKFRKKELANVFFNINWSLILTETSTIVTYLIITSQFDTPSNVT